MKNVIPTRRWRISSARRDFSKEDKGLLRDWMAVARRRLATNVDAMVAADLRIAAE